MISSMLLPHKIPSVFETIYRFITISSVLVSLFVFKQTLYWAYTMGTHSTVIHVKYLAINSLKFLC